MTTRKFYKLVSVFVAMLSNIVSLLLIFGALAIIVQADDHEVILYK